MRLLLSSGFCGMSPLQGSIAGGSYFLIEGLMQVVFEFGHLRAAKEDMNTTVLLNLPERCPPYYYLLLVMEILTLFLCLCLWGSIWAQKPMGILGFAVWLTLFDVVLVVVTSLLQEEKFAKGLVPLSSLSWFGIACRFVGDSFWLSFVITHGLKTYIEKRNPRARWCNSLTEDEHTI